jgi:hypothetical protein
VIAKEDAEREAYQRHFEDASKKNDVRVNYYLNHYYAPPKEKDYRSNMVSEMHKMNSHQKRKIKVLKKRKADFPNDSTNINKNNMNPISHELDAPFNDQYNHNFPDKPQMLKNDFRASPLPYEQYHP